MTMVPVRSGSADSTHFDADRSPVPPEDKLVAALTQYAREQLTVKRRLARLSAELGYNIK